MGWGETLLPKDWQPVHREGNLNAASSGKNKDTENAEEDIREGIKRLGRFADYLVINLSSPNTQGLRALQQRDHLRRIITTAQSELDKLEKQEAHQANIAQPEDAKPDATETSRDITHKAHDFFPTQTGKRPLLFVKIAVRQLYGITTTMAKHNPHLD